MSNTDTTETTAATTIEPRLGDYVQTRRFGSRGRVTKLHWSCPESEEWQSIQTGLAPEQFTQERWASILCQPAGAVVVPFSDVEVVEPFPFTNPYAADYFRD